MTEMIRMTGIPGDLHDVLRARISTPQGDGVSLLAIVSNCQDLSKTAHGQTPSPATLPNCM
jgi:hypothetical protein